MINENLEITKKNKRGCYIENHICIIPLQNGKVAICDEDRFDEVIGYSWCKAKKDVRGGIQGKGKYVRLHSLLYPSLKIIDHINGDICDNRSCNLRPATVRQNSMNRKISCNNS